MSVQTAQSLAQAPTPHVDVERHRTMLAAWRYYRGGFEMPLNGKVEDNVISNRLAPIVDKGVSFLFGNVLTITVDAMATDSAQEYLDAAWGDDDDRMTLLANLGLNGGVSGTAYIKIVPPAPEQGVPYPRFVALDPSLVRIVTAPDDVQLVMAYIIEYASGAYTKRQIIERMDPSGQADVLGTTPMSDTWTITNWQRKTQDLGTTLTTNDYEQVGEAVEWPYRHPPIFHCQNLPNPNEANGMADITHDLIGINQSLNFVQSNVKRILRFHAHPKTFATGVDASQIMMGVDDVLCLSAPDAMLHNLEMVTDLHSSMNFADQLRADMDEQSRVPAAVTGRLKELPRGISGVALEMLYQPLVEKTTMKQRLYGRMLRDACKMALVLGGQITEDEWDTTVITLHWQNLLPADDAAAAQVAMVYASLGISKQTIFSRLGFNYDAETEQATQEQADQVTAYAQGRGMPPPDPNVTPQAPQNATGGPPQ